MFKRKNPGPPGWLLLIFAAVLLLLLAGAQGYVSWAAQYHFIDAAKHASLPSMLEALGLDTAAVIFALLGLAHARMGRSAPIERTLNVACALGSMTMNLLSASLGSPRSIAVYVLPAILYSACSDRLIATAGHLSGVREKSTWRWVGRTCLYLLRTALAPFSTLRGMRLRLLELTPLPETRVHATAEPSTVPAVTGDVPVNTGDVPEEEEVQAPPAPRKPLEDVLADAEREFSSDIDAETVPGYRDIRERLGVGQSRAEKVRAHLTEKIRERRAIVAHRDDDQETETFSAIRDQGAGQPVHKRSYQQLPVTPGG